jgi:hypothetical protein
MGRLRKVVCKGRGDERDAVFFAHADEVGYVNGAGISE